MIARMSRGEEVAWLSIVSWEGPSDAVAIALAIAPTLMGYDLIIEALR